MGRCRHCGSETGEGELFCANCGARLEEENPETGAAAETEEAEQEQATEPGAREADPRAAGAWVFDVAL